MVSNSVMENKSMKFDDAKGLVIQEFLRAHPIESLPDWVNPCVTIGGTINTDGMWQIDFSVCHKQSLRENEYWEERNGGRVLVKIDPATGQKKVILSRLSDSPPIVLFSALVNPHTKAVSVVVDSDFTKLDGNIYARIDE